MSNQIDVLAVMDRRAAECEMREFTDCTLGAKAATTETKEARAAVAELVEAAREAKRAYWLARNSAAGLSNYCEESASSRRCERELSEAEAIWRSAGLDAALAKFGGAK